MGRTISWLTLLLVLLIVLDVILRYLFNFGSVANAEMEWHLFGILIMLSVGYTYKGDRHVRVDVFYQRFSDNQKHWVDLLGTLLFLLPFCIVGAYKSWPFMMSSFAINETSPDPGGLPARFLIKGTIPLGFILLGLQAIAKAVRCFTFLAKHD